jgi:hypothetical protein
MFFLEFDPDSTQRASQGGKPYSRPVLVLLSYTAEPVKRAARLIPETYCFPYCALTITNSVL